MDVFEAIRSRASIGKVLPEPVDRALVEQILEAGTWAPNHHHTEPWRFFVLTGEGRKPLGRVMAAVAAAKMADPESPENQARLHNEAAKALRAPVIIAVSAHPTDKPNIVRVEEVAAASAAVQNMLLAAHALGLGAVWRTGPATLHPLTKQLFGLGPEDELVGFVYLGHPDMQAPPRHRIATTDKTTWIDTDQEHWQ
ncbi:MAG: nitroreductase [Firmicutes bacterium]|nr:nitroreductase [Bacillota bacterium]